VNNSNNKNNINIINLNISHIIKNTVFYVIFSYVMLNLPTDINKWVIICM